MGKDTVKCFKLDMAKAKAWYFKCARHPPPHPCNFLQTQCRNYRMLKFTNLLCLLHERYKAGLDPQNCNYIKISNYMTNFHIKTGQNYMLEMSYYEADLLCINK